RFPLLDLVAAEDELLALGRLKHELFGGVLDGQAGHDSTVVERDDERAEVVADGRARVEDRAEQLVAAVLGANRREVGADPLAAALDPVAARAGVGAGAEEDLAALLGAAFLADHVKER